MSKRVVRVSREPNLMHKWWVRVIIALAFFAAAYGFISLAIDSGHLLEYAAGLMLLWYAVHHIVRAVKPNY